MRKSSMDPTFEVGQDCTNNTFIRVLDQGGLVWEGRDDYKMIKETFNALDAGLKEWITEEYDK